MPPMVLTSWALLIWDELNKRGCDARAKFKQAGLNPERLGDANARYSVVAMQKLWALAIEASGDHNFAYKVGRQWRPTTFHALGYTWLACTTLAEGLKRVARYSRVVNSGVDISFQPSGSFGELIIHIQYHQFAIHQGAHDAALGALMTMLRMLMGESYSPMEIHCFYARPATAINFEHDVRCPILYAMPANKVLFDNADLHRQLASANTELQKINEDLLLEKMHQLDRACMVTRVTQAINKELPTGEVNEKDIAASLGVSLRTMQRQLAKQQQSFKQLLDEIRKQLAEQYLANSQLSLNEITYLLGFANQANFTRAFKRWHGMPPSSYRQQRLKLIA
jgi:AraC-like DNA-binding protein